LPATVAQRVLCTLDQTRQSFFAARAAWNEDRSQFLGPARLPGCPTARLLDCPTARTSSRGATCWSTPSRS